MTSVTPSESASQGAASDDVAFVRLQGPGDLSSVIAGLAAVPGCSIGDVRDVVGKWSGAYHAYLKKSASLVSSGTGSRVSSVSERSSVSVASPASSVSEQVGDRGNGKRLEGFKRGSGLVDVRAQVEPTPASRGYCYLMMVKPRMRGAVAKICGANPTFSVLLNLSSESVVDDLSGLYVAGCGFVRHLTAFSGGSSPSLLGVLSSLAVGRRGDLGSLAARVVEFGEFEDSDVGLHHCLGGNADDLKGWLQAQVGVQREFDQRTRDLQLVSKSAAMCSAAEKSRLRVYEAVGDAALTHVLARRCLMLGKTVQEYQAARSACTNNAAMSALFVRKFPVSMFSFSSDVVPGVGVVGAKTVEAVLGFVDETCGYEVVEKLVDTLGLLTLAGHEFTREVGTGPQVDGLCYLAMVRSSDRERCAARLGEYPTVHQLMQLPAVSVLPHVELMKLGLRVEGVVAHVELEGGDLFESFASYVSTTQLQYGHATIGAYFQDCVALGTCSGQLEVALRADTKVGGGYAVMPAAVGLVDRVASGVTREVVFPSGMPKWPSQIGEAAIRKRGRSRTKLTEQDRVAMVEVMLQQPTIKHSELADKFGVDRSTVTKVIGAYARARGTSDKFSLPFYVGTTYSSVYSAVTPSVFVETSFSFDHSGKWCLSRESSFDLRIGYVLEDSDLGFWQDERCRVEVYWVESDGVSEVHPVDLRSLSRREFSCVSGTQAEVGELDVPEREGTTASVVVSGLVFVANKAKRYHSSRGAAAYILVDLLANNSDTDEWDLVVSVASFPVKFTNDWQRSIVPEPASITREMLKFGSAQV